MKNEEFKKQVIRLWGQRERGNHKRIDVLGFYGYLQSNHPELLKFRYRGDKYQQVMMWLTPYIVE